MYHKSDSWCIMNMHTQGGQIKTQPVCMKNKYAHTINRRNCVKMTLWNSSVFTLACLPGSYRFSEFRDGNAVSEGVAVAGVVHQNARQEHGAQVVSVEDVHGQSRGGRASVWGIRSAVLEDEQMPFNFNTQIHRRFVALCTGAAHCWS